MDSKPNTNVNICLDLGAGVIRELKRRYFVPLNEHEVPVKYRIIMSGWKEMAARINYKGPIAWAVRRGFSLENASTIGPCFGELKYLNNCRYLDEPTRESLVFWIPHLVPGSLYKHVRSQKALLALFRADYQLPENHLRSFGSSSLLSGLVLSYYVMTGCKVLRGVNVRTSTLTTGKARFTLGWYQGQLISELWRNDDQRYANVGVFPVGIEDALLPTD